MKKRTWGIGALGFASFAAGAIAWLTPMEPLRAKDDLSGKWVVASVTTTVAKVPVVGKIYAKTRMVVLHDLEQDGDRLRGGGTLCRIDIDSGSKFVDTKLPKKFKQALPTPYFDGVVVDDDGKTSIRTGRRLVVMGAKLKKPAKDDLPKNAKDSRVVDQDRDGNPGVTISIDGIVSGDIHVATRSWTRFLGKGDGAGKAFEGKVYFDQEQNILSTTSSMLEKPPETKPVPSKSWFKMVRVSKDATCGDARRITNPWFK